MKEEAAELTAAAALEIVRKLRSENPEIRQRGLAALVAGPDAILLTIDNQRILPTATPGAETARLFTALLWATQTIAKNLNMDLHWVKQSTGPEIVLPGRVVPMR